MSMKTLRARASLSALLVAAAIPIANTETPGLDPDALMASVQAETEEELDAMDDEDVESLNDDEATDALAEEDEDEIEAASDEDMDAAEDDETADKPSARVLATRIARNATAKVTAPKDSKPSKASGPSGSNGIDPEVAAEIQGLKEAKGQEALAASLSIDPNMTVAKAKRHLAAAAKSKSSRLSSVPNPPVGGSSAPSGKGLKAADQAQRASAKALREKAGQA